MSKRKLAKRIDYEKGAMVYLSLFKRVRNVSLIDEDHFYKKWRQMFKEDASGHMSIMRAVYERTVGMAGITEESVIAYRESWFMNQDRIIPNELKQLAEQTVVEVQIAKNTDRHLSGYRIVRRESNQDVLVYPDYSATERDIKKYLSKQPPKEAVLKSEKYLLDILRNEESTISHKANALSRYNQNACTKEFARAIERLIKNTNSMQILNAACYLAQRLDIKNSMNNKPLKKKINEKAYVPLEKIPPFNDRDKVKRMLNDCVTKANISNDYTEWSKGTAKLIKRTMFELYPKEAELVHDRKHTAKLFYKWIEPYCKM